MAADATAAAQRPVLPPGSAPVSVLGPVRVSTAADEVADRLVTAIALGEFVPGERLPVEREMCRLLGVSRSTVREAVGRLRAAGILETRRGRSGGAYVLTSWTDTSAAAVRRTLAPQRGELEQLFDLRGLVESMIARAAAQRRTDADIATLHAALTRFATAETPEEEHAADGAVHLAVVQANHNPQVSLLSRDLLARVSLGFTIEPYSRQVYKRALAEHTALVESVVEGDVERAGQVAGAHFSMSADTLRRILDRGEGAESAQRAAR